MKNSRTRFFSFTNNPQNENGIVTIATKLVGSVEPGKEAIRVGFHLTDPNSCFDRTLAKKEAKKAMLSNMCVTMANRFPGEDRMDIARSAWCVVGKDFPNNPDWAKKIDLAMKAVLV